MPREHCCAATKSASYFSDSTCCRRSTPITISRSPSTSTGTDSIRTASRSSRICWGWADGCTTSRRSFPAASSSAWRSRARLSASRKSCWPMSRRGTWIRRVPKPFSSLLRQLNKDLGQTIVMITHNPEAATYGDRVLHMRDGMVVNGRPPTEMRYFGKACPHNFLVLRPRELAVRRAGRRDRALRAGHAAKLVPRPASFQRFPESGVQLVSENSEPDAHVPARCQSPLARKARRPINAGA